MLIQELQKTATLLPPERWPVTLTPQAVRKIKEARKAGGLEGKALRLVVKGGGCSGFTYGLDFDDQASEDELLYRVEDLDVVVDPVSADYLAGTEVDYASGLTSAGFKFQNPNAVRTCGCGESF
jgi:iron-sulfur cluster insertion protein